MIQKKCEAGRTQRTIYLSNEVIKDIESEAQKNQKSVSAYIEDILKEQGGLVNPLTAIRNHIRILKAFLIDEEAEVKKQRDLLSAEVEVEKIARQMEGKDTKLLDAEYAELDKRVKEINERNRKIRQMSISAEIIEDKLKYV
jgi:hypothetical protein